MPTLLSTLFRLVFYWLLLLLLAPCIQQGVSCSVDAYLAAWNMPQLLHLIQAELWFQIAAGLGVLFALTRLLGLAWNLIFLVSLLAFLVECLALTIGMDWGAPSMLRSLSLLQPLHNIAAQFPALMFLVPLACVLASFCSRTPGRILSYTLTCYILWYATSELLAWLVSQWKDSETPFLPELLHMVQAYPWLEAALPGIFFFLFCLLMALLDGLPAPKAHEVTKPEEAPKPLAAASPIPLPPVPQAIPAQQEAGSPQVLTIPAQPEGQPAAAEEPTPSPADEPARAPAETPAQEPQETPAATTASTPPAPVPAPTEPEAQGSAEETPSTLPSDPRHEQTPVPPAAPAL